MPAQIVKLANYNDSAKSWSAKDALIDLLAHIEKENLDVTQLIIHYVHKTPDNKFKSGKRSAGVNFMEHVALLNLALSETMDEWRQRD